MSNYLICFVLIHGGAGHRFGDTFVEVPGESGITHTELEKVRKALLGESKNAGVTQVIFTSINKLA